MMQRFNRKTKRICILEIQIGFCLSLHTIERSYFLTRDDRILRADLSKKVKIQTEILSLPISKLVPC